jgi:hypothetical protein
VDDLRSLGIGDLVRDDGRREAEVSS